MDSYCADRGCGFTLALLPAGSAYVNGAYQLDEMYSEILAYAESKGIDAVPMTEEFVRGIARNTDESDHLGVGGNRLIAETIARHLRPFVPARLGGKPPTNPRIPGSAALGAP